MNDTYYFIYDGGFVTLSGSYNHLSNDIGETLEDYESGKYVLLTEEQSEFLLSHPGVTPEEAFNMEVSLKATQEDKESLVYSILEYDSSPNVNKFLVNNQEVWFDKETRVSLNNSINIESSVGKDTTTIWIKGSPYTISIESAKQFLTDLEIYAIACYNNTQNNIAEVDTLDLKEDVKNFDITKGYPEILSFNF